MPFEYHKEFWDWIKLNQMVCLLLRTIQWNIYFRCFFINSLFLWVSVRLWHHRHRFISLTHWGWVMHICVGKPTIIGSDNGLSPDRRQAIIWTNAVILLIGPLGTNFSEILTAIQIFLFKKMHLKMSSAKRRSFCLGLNVSMNILRQFTCVTARRKTPSGFCKTCLHNYLWTE